MVHRPIAGTRPSEQKKASWRHVPQQARRDAQPQRGCGGAVESVHGLCINNNNIHKAYLAAGTFIDGHFVEMPAVINEDIDLAGTSFCPLPEDDKYLDDIHLCPELTHFYEVDIDQSMLDPGASETTQGESRILAPIVRQKSKEEDRF